MKTIAFYNNKGGVGKTTLAANVGYNLSTMGYTIKIFVLRWIYHIRLFIRGCISCVTVA